MSQLRNFLRHAYPYSKTRINQRKEKKLFNKLLHEYQGKPLKVVVGSGQIYTDGWIPSEIHILNLLRESDWTRYFEKNSLDGLLAEHVWEHLSPENGAIAARTCHTFLKKGKRLRVAVPDGYHPDPKYIDYVKPGGHGLGADDHKVLYNYKTFTKLFEDNGFRVEAMEYFDENGKFHSKDWEKEDGYVYRTIRYDKRNADGKPNYTSLMIDAYKE